MWRDFHLLPANILGFFCGNQKLIVLHPCNERKHRKRKNSSNIYLTDASDDGRHDGCRSLGSGKSLSPF